MESSSDSYSEEQYSAESCDSSLDSDKSDQEDDSDSSPVSPRKHKIYKVPIKSSVRSTDGQKNINKFAISLEDYFWNHSKKKSVTSGHTLNKLERPRLPQDSLQKILSTTKLSATHAKAYNSLTQLNVSYFNKWICVLHEDFNILLYGLGSKKHILQKFHEECLGDSPVLVVNGFFPSLTVKNILDGIILDILELKENPANAFEACKLIKTEFSHLDNTHLYIILHNIEGMTLRNGKSQNILSTLAAIKNIHFIASVDHINTSLIWNNFKLSKFKFVWWDVTSFMPYVNETCYENTIMLQKSGALTLSSLSSVFTSLTTNSRSIYLIIVKHQLENDGTQHYPGLLFKDLYWKCRESFLVSSDLALRAQLTEFLDHKMVKYRRTLDGGEHLIIPVNNSLLKQFLDEQNK